MSAVNNCQLISGRLKVRFPFRSTEAEIPPKDVYTFNDPALIRATVNYK